MHVMNSFPLWSCGSLELRKYNVILFLKDVPENSDNSYSDFTTVRCTHPSWLGQQIYMYVHLQYVLGGLAGCMHTCEVCASYRKMPSWE